MKQEQIHSSEEPEDINKGEDYSLSEQNINPESELKSPKLTRRDFLRGATALAAGGLTGKIEAAEPGQEGKNEKIESLKKIIERQRGGIHLARSA